MTPPLSKFKNLGGEGCTTEPFSQLKNQCARRWLSNAHTMNYGQTIPSIYPSLLYSTCNDTTPRHHLGYQPTHSGPDHRSTSLTTRLADWLVRMMTTGTINVTLTKRYRDFKPLQTGCLSTRLKFDMSLKKRRYRVGLGRREETKTGISKYYFLVNRYQHEKRGAAQETPCPTPASVTNYVDLH